MNTTDITLLYVEDDVEVRDRICAELGLTYHGMRIYVAGNGLEGLDTYREHRPDIVVTDINMPGMDGVRMAGEIKALDEETLVIAVTAYSDTEYLLRAIDAGISRYVLKPVSYEKLFAVIDKSIAIVTLKKQVREQNEQIRILSRDLAERADELEEANRELETFNHTVAHDLRKPLTVINGYCQTLMALCNEKLDEECIRFIQEAYEGTLRMNRLIDALLLFSQTAHAEPKRETVDLSRTAEELAEELKLAEPWRRVSFRIAPELAVEGDANLLRVMVANLFGNAWKYTSDREEAMIEFGALDVDGRTTFFVRDNGIGFAGSEAGEIFTPFRRLPEGERMGGLGIGLGTVERVVRRHGGKIWAEGEPGKGATFYFTLGDLSMR